MENYDEFELLRSLQKGNDEAYLILYKRYHLLLYKWVLKFVKVPQLAEDLVQDVFLKVWQIRARLNPKQSFPAFIYKISRNKAFTMLKKIAADEKLRMQVMVQLSNTAESAENIILWHQYEQLLTKAIAQLPPQRQKVFKLCRQEFKSYEEVALALGISRNTVKEHIVMAVKNIKEYLIHYGDISFICIFFFLSQ